MRKLRLTVVKEVHVIYFQFTWSGGETMLGVIGEIKTMDLLTKIIPAIQKITGEYSTTTTKPVTVMQIAKETDLSPSIIGKTILQTGNTLFHMEIQNYTRYGKIGRHLKAVYLHF